MAPKHLVLLPGLDGTGELFTAFVAALGERWSATVVAYPADKFLPYADLRSFVTAAVPASERFVLIAESFSTPLAVLFAANAPTNLAALVVCAGFVRSPALGWSKPLEVIANPWLFRLKPPRVVLDYFLLGQNAPPDLRQKLSCALHRVNPQVLSNRVREVLNCDVRDDLRRTLVSLLYLEASDDRLLPSTCKEDFSRSRSNVLFRSIPGPHLLLQREPQKTADVVTDFICSLP